MNEKCQTDRNNSQTELKNKKPNSYHHEARSLSLDTHGGEVESGSERMTSGGRQQHIETSQSLILKRKKKKCYDEEYSGCNNKGGK